MEKLDYKKAYRDLYLPGTEPVVVSVPEMSFFMVGGKGNPNDEKGEFQRAMELLYALTFTIKMSKMSGNQPTGYFEYVVPPLEALWWLNDRAGMDFSCKDEFHWTAMIRQPEFVTDEVFQRACDTVTQKKPHIDVKNARFHTFEEGLCVQAMHIGPYDDEPRTLEKIESHIRENSLENDLGGHLSDGTIRRHHEIYLSDPRKTAPEKLMTVLRHPVKR